MRLVETMTLPPNNCMSCGRGNTPDGATGQVGPFVDLEIDYNWGDSGYFCEDCAGKVAACIGWISPQIAADKDEEIKSLGRKIHDLEGEIDMRRRRERARGLPKPKKVKA
jgi:hypothetical protein